MYYGYDAKVSPKYRYYRFTGVNKGWIGIGHGVKIYSPQNTKITKKYLNVLKTKITKKY